MKCCSKCWHCNAIDRRCQASLYTMNWETQRFIVDRPRLAIIKKWNVTVSNDAMVNAEISTTFGWEITGTSSFSRSFLIQSKYWIITTWISLVYCKRVQRLVYSPKYFKIHVGDMISEGKENVFSFDIVENRRLFCWKSHHKL